MDLWTRTPLAPRTRVSRIVGRRRVEGVELAHLDDARTEAVACDTVIFTGDWIPENELARLGGLAIDPGTRGPRVDAAYRTSARGVFAAGNLLRGAETADASALEGQRAARCLADYLRRGAWPAAPLPLLADEPLEWVLPNAITSAGPPPATLTFRVRGFIRGAQVGVFQGERRLHAQSFRELQPNRTLRLAGDWAAAVKLDGEPLRAALLD
jgi:hypothetical protein